MFSREALLVACAACSLTFDPGGTTAQTYPVRPIRVVVPYAPGGATDLTGRTVGEESEKFAKLIKLSGAKGTD